MDQLVMWLRAQLALFINFTKLAPWQHDALLLAAMLFNILLVVALVHGVLMPILGRVVKFSRSKTDDWLWERYIFLLLRVLPPILIIFTFANFFRLFPNVLFVRIAQLLIIFVSVTLLVRGIDDVTRILERLNMSAKLHLRGISQAIKLIVYLLAGVFAIAILVGKPPWTLVGGLGALTAVLLLVFRDTILGLVAGVQLAANQMVKLGDWVELPEHNADGSVVDLSLTTVKIENWDKSVTFLPAYILVSNAFKNWRAMQELGVRRIKRSIYINIASIRFVNDVELENYKALPHLRNFFERLAERKAYHNVEAGMAFIDAKARKFHYTTASLYRLYTIEYLLAHPQIRNDLTVLARMMPPTAKGMGLELYCFTATADFLIYETIQSNVFEHLLAAASYFDLTVFQDPSGLDMRQFYQAKVAKLK